METLLINKLTGKNGGLTINNINLGPYDRKILTSIPSTGYEIDFGSLMSYDFFKEDGTGTQLINNFTFSIKNTSSSDCYIQCLSSNTVSAGCATIQANSSYVDINNSGKYNECNLLYKRYFFPIEIKKFTGIADYSSITSQSTVNKIKSYNSSATSDSFDNNDDYKKIFIQSLNYNTVVKKSVGNYQDSVDLEDNQFYVLNFSQKEGSNTLRSFSISFLHDSSNFLVSDAVIQIGLMDITASSFISIKKNKITIEMNGFSSSVTSEFFLFKTPLKINSVSK